MPVFLVCRALFGIAMGGEWGVGSALALEVLPAARRGFFSGLLQEGYVVGNLLAAALFALLFPHLHGTGMLAPWRILFMIGALPCLPCLLPPRAGRRVPAWLESRRQKLTAPRTATPLKTTLASLRSYLPSLLFLALLMTAFTAFSHGTQDLYPSFLEHDRGLGPTPVGLSLSLATSAPSPAASPVAPSPSASAAAAPSPSPPSSPSP